ncbi:MAG: DUF4249 family protein [Bacteroidales bacterium]|nr:DUF4249 family protein [Bacteroidales bacterium]
MRKIFYIIVLLFLFGCEKKTEWQLKEKHEDLVVVDGIITDEQKSHEIKITHSVTELNEVPQPVIGANVVISNEDSVWNLTEQPANSGIYKTGTSFSAKTGKNYTLLIDYTGKTYTAKTYMVSGENFVPLVYAKNDDGKFYHIVRVCNPYAPNHPAMWELSLDWSNLPAYIDSLPEKCKAKFMYYSLPTIDVSEVLPPEIEKVSFPAGTKIVERRYSLTPEHVEFLRALLSETTWSGGLFDSAHSNVPTNLSEGAAGFFGACAVTTVTIYVLP